METQKTVIFDFDGTLADTIALVGRLYNENAARFGARPIDLNALPEYRKLGYKKSMKQLGIRWTVLPKLALFISREMKTHMEEVVQYDGVIEVLRNLQADGIRIGVLTSNNAALVAEFFDRHQFPSFDFVVSERTLFGKDKALRKIMKRLQVASDTIVYVGDEPRDVFACHKAGVPVVGVTWGVGGREGLEPSKPDRLVDTAKELEVEIKRLLERN